MVQSLRRTGVTKMAVTVKLDGLKNAMKKLQARGIKQSAAELVIRETKSFITRGISPVKGERRFEGYKNPKKYPADRKPNRPVNMTLTGAMLDALTYKILNGTSFSIGWYSGEEGEKANNHNTGDTVPKRRLLPTETNESFNVSITRSLANYYAKILSDILKR